MKTIKKVNIKKGEEIIYKGESLHLTKHMSLKVSANSKSDEEKENKAEAPQASHQTDKPQAVDKATVLGIVQKEIDDLETKEHQLLISDSQHDYLFELEEQRAPTLDDHMGLAFQVTNLKKILKNN